MKQAPTTESLADGHHPNKAGGNMLGPSAHTDTFARDNLPPPDERPDFLLDGLYYPERLNAGVELTDCMVDKGFGDHTAFIGNGRRRTYKELSDWTNRLAHALVESYGVKPGNRVLIRSANNPAMTACWLAATKAGAVVVNIMPMLRLGRTGWFSADSSHGDPPVFLTRRPRYKARDARQDAGPHRRRITQNPASGKNHRPCRIRKSPFDVTMEVDKRTPRTQGENRCVSW
jgi:hypothetical protein